MVNDHMLITSDAISFNTALRTLRRNCFWLDFRTFKIRKYWNGSLQEVKK